MTENPQQTIIEQSNRIMKLEMKLRDIELKLKGFVFYGKQNESLWEIAESINEVL
jgi:hypothetical protein